MIPYNQVFNMGGLNLDNPLDFAMKLQCAIVELNYAYLNLENGIYLTKIFIEFQ